MSMIIRLTQCYKSATSNPVAYEKLHFFVQSINEGN
jgi:hypothetical protein